MPIRCGHDTRIMEELRVEVSGRRVGTGLIGTAHQDESRELNGQLTCMLACFQLSDFHAVSPYSAQRKTPQRDPQYPGRAPHAFSAHVRVGGNKGKDAISRQAVVFVVAVGSEVVCTGQKNPSFARHNGCRLVKEWTGSRWEKVESDTLNHSRGSESIRGSWKRSEMVTRHRNKRTRRQQEKESAHWRCWCSGGKELANRCGFLFGA